MTISDMRRISREHGYNYFDRDTVRYWNSAIHTAPNKWGLFVESVMFGEERTYNIKHFNNKTAKITGLLLFDTLAEAKAMRKELTDHLAFLKSARERDILENLASVNWSIQYGEKCLEFCDGEGNFFIVDTRQRPMKTFC